MMSPAAERIRSKIALLQDEKRRLEGRINELRKADRHLKDEVHHLEADVLVDPHPASERMKVNKLFHQVSQIRHDKHQLHDNEHALRRLEQELRELTKTITTCEFWLKQAAYGDAAKQEEAIRRVFGRV